MKKPTLLVLVFVLILSGCAAKSNIVSISPDTFMVSRQAATGFSDLSTLKSDLFQEADEYCKSRNKHISVINTIESPPAYIWGKFPKVEIQFMCL